MKSRRKKPKNTLHNLRPITLDITDLSRSGAGFGRDETGRAVFVAYTAPGDTVKAKLTKQKSKYAEADLMQIIEASPDRVEPRCEVFTKCGGCQWQHIPYEQQWQMKTRGVFDSLKLNQIKLPTDCEEFPAVQQWHYRNRIQLKGNKNHNSATDEIEIGFFASQSNQLVPIKQCLIAAEALNDNLPQVLENAENQSSTFKVELNLETDGSITQHWNLHHGAAGFRQVNDEQNLNLRNWVAENIRHDLPLYDLYGGEGNLSLSLANKLPSIDCVDKYVPEPGSKQIPGHFQFHAMTVAGWLNKQKSDQSVEKTALLDPPREGLGDDAEEIINNLKKTHVKTVVLIGCKTDPWSRDLSRFLSHGWQLQKIAIFDFFPQTSHVETAAVLTRK